MRWRQKGAGGVNVTDDDLSAVFYAALDAYKADMIAAEQRGYLRGVEDAAKVCENVHPSSDDYDGWEQGKLDCVAAIRGIKP
jgi:hypothetical protein